MWRLACETSAARTSQSCSSRTNPYIVSYVTFIPNWREERSGCVCVCVLGCELAFTACSLLAGVRSGSANLGRAHSARPNWTGIQSFPAAGGESAKSPSHTSSCIPLINKNKAR